MILELNNIDKRYDSPAGKQSLAVLRGVSLAVAPGDAIAVVGPSGSGKSTLLNIIGALDRPTSGSVVFSGRNLSELNDRELAKVRNTEIGFVFQLHHLLPQCTVLENVLIPTLPLVKKAARADAEDRARELLRRVGLASRSDSFPAQLSGGERQRVAVVRALINSPKLLLADEPTGSLDQESAQGLGQLILDLNRERNLAVIVVTHSPDLANRMDSVYRLQHGSLERAGQA